MEHYQEIDIAKSVAAFRSSVLGDILVSNTKYVKILIRPPVPLRRQTTAVVNRCGCDVQKLMFTIIVRCVDDAKVEHEAG